MAIHTTIGTEAVSTSWLDVDFITVVSVSPDAIVVLNSDGSETRFLSSRGDLHQDAGGVSGTVSSIARTSDGGGIVYETVSGISVGAGDLLAAGGRLFDVTLDTAVTLSANGAAHLDEQSFSVANDVLRWNSDALGAGPAGVGDDTVAGSSVVAYLEDIQQGPQASTGAYNPSDIMLGSPFADWLSTNTAKWNIVAGTAGDDTFAGGGGNLIVGGGGSNTISFADAKGPVYVDLAQGVAKTANGKVDRLQSIENVIGSAFGDWIIGDSNANVIRGGKGSDTITLGGGDDIVVFARGDGVDTITDFGIGGHDVLQIMNFGNITSFADMIAQQQIVTVEGHAEISLGMGDAIILSNVTSLTQLSASQFRF